MSKLSSPSDCHRAALQYRDRGWSVIPIMGDGDRKRSKGTWKEFQDRIASREEVDSWWADDPEAGVGIVTGAISGLVVIDIDGPEGEAAIGKLIGPTRTLSARTGGGGRHLFFRHPGGKIRTRAGVLEKVDVRADGGYIIAPPSLHESGNRYEWEDGDEVTVAHLPQPLLDLLLRSPSKETTPAAADDAKVGEGRRNEALTKLAGRLFGKGYSVEDTLRQCLEWNQAYCVPPLIDREVHATVMSIAQREESKRARGRKASRGKPVIGRLSEVKSEAVQWLWNGRFPLGKLTIIQGDPGLGKSTLTLDLAARVSAGLQMPDGSPGVSGGVVLISAEDAYADTVRPRLLAMGGDPDRVAVIHHMDLQEGGTRPLVLPDDVEAVRQAVDEVGAKLIVVDPIVAVLSKAVNSWSDQDVRGALLPLQMMAEKVGAALVFVTHLNKKEGRSAIQRGGGSVAFNAAARAVFQVASHPADSGHRVLACVKFNNAVMPSSWVFHLETAANGGSRVVWDGETTLTADDTVDAGRSSRRSDAADFLRGRLAGGPAPTVEVEQDALSQGIRKRTLERARKDLRVQSRHRGYGKNGRVMLSLPATAEGNHKKKELAESDGKTSSLPNGKDQPSDSAKDSI